MKTFWTRSGTTWLMAKSDVSAEDFDVTDGSSFPDAYAVERLDDGEGKAVLFVCGPCEVLDREFLESVGGERRRDFVLLALEEGQESADSKTIDELRYVTF